MSAEEQLKEARSFARYFLERSRKVPDLGWVKEAEDWARKIVNKDEIECRTCKDSLQVKAALEEAMGMLEIQQGHVVTRKIYDGWNRRILAILAGTIAKEETP